MNKNIIYQGAEAILKLRQGKIVKQRVPKTYRLKLIDEKLRKLRTRSEAKLLQKMSKISPTVYEVDEQTKEITMDYLQGDILKDIFDAVNKAQRKKIMIQVGKAIAYMHEQHAIHGDLTTSNMILQEGKIYFIDYGLGYVSIKTEDKAVDLRLLKQALKSKHHVHAEESFDHMLQGYVNYQDSKAVLQRLEKVEQRGRYKRKNA